MIKNRYAALAVIIFIYVLAVLCGLFTYDFFEGKFSAGGGQSSFWLSLLLADISATILVFIFSLIFHNASVYDPYWSVQPPVILAVALHKMNENGTGTTLMGWLLFAAVLFWALRLTGNWIYNFKSFEYQDWRYLMLKEKTGPAYPLINFLGIHMFPTLVVYLCVLPAVTAIVQGAVFKPLCLAFIALCFAATIFQGLADIQMHRFRNSGAGGFIQTGLWKKSRHPNYACEILMWWGIGFASLIATGGPWWLLAGAVVNTLMFLFISIPMADKHQARKPGFEEYKKSTRIL